MVSTLLTPTSFCLFIWRRSETGDRFEMGERQRIFSTVGEHSVLPFLYLYAVSDKLLLHIRFHFRCEFYPHWYHLYCIFVGRGVLTPPFIRFAP